MSYKNFENASEFIYKLYFHENIEDSSKRVTDLTLIQRTKTTLKENGVFYDFHLDNLSFNREIYQPGCITADIQIIFQASNVPDSSTILSQDDLKKMHGIMTGGIVSDSGSYRNHEEGVFHGDVCIFIAPPHRMVPDHMNNLFEWMSNARKSVHPLILSSVFHYEFVFIHPFSDGNGRMARLWQTALLSDWNPIFQYLPLESHIHEFQEAYYDAISAGHIEGNSDKFILFMLERINITLDQALQQISAGISLPKTVQKLLDVMEYDEPYTADELLSLLGMKSKASLRKNYLVPALENGSIVMKDPDHPTSRNQAYIKKS